MSGIAGVLSFSGSVDSSFEQLSKLSDALCGRGPDDRNIICHAGIGMVYRALHVSAESRRTRQPVTTAEGWLIAWDGRLDHRHELQRQIDRRPGVESTDVELVIGAYRRWGEAFCEHLVGDFALALWDAPRRRLWLARDPFGCRSLFFALQGERILWASSPKALLATGEIAAEVDDEWIVAYLINAQSTDRSPYRTIQVVPPGHAVVLEPERLCYRRFWCLDSGKEIRYTRDEDYEEAFREHFTEAVRCRLRAAGTVCAELSGGLDSSSIVCVADRLIRGGKAESPELITTSLVFDRASGSDEREYIHAVEQRTGCARQHVAEDDYPALAGFDKPWTQVPHFWQLWLKTHRRIAEIMHENGARILLSGVGGDHLLWSSIPVPFHLADHIARWRWRQLLRDLNQWHQGGDQPWLRLLWTSSIKPLWRATRGLGAEEPAFEFAWLGPEHRPRIQEYFAHSLEQGTGFLLPSQRTRQESVRSAINDVSWMLDDSELGIERSYPFLDRMLVEFCLAIPFTQHVRPKESRSLHRRALRDLLPPKIANRHHKRGPGEAMLRAVQREWPRISELFEDAQVYARGYVCRERFLERLEKLRFGIRDDLGALIRVLQAEIWLRSLDA